VHLQRAPIAYWIANLTKEARFAPTRMKQR
jgi:hypothetical protein